MILFTKENAEKILLGLKTQTRRFWLTQRMSPGKEYYAQTSLKPESRFAKLRCLRIWKWDCESISEEDAKAEGYASADEFLEAYKQLNQHKINRAEEREHYAIEFELTQKIENGNVTFIQYFSQEYFVDDKTGQIYLGEGTRR